MAKLEWVALCIALLFVAACASAPPPAPRTAPPLANAVPPPSFTVLGRGEFGCFADDVFRSRNWEVSESGRYMILKVQCYRGRRFLSTSFEIVDLLRNDVVATFPFLGGIGGGSNETALAFDGDDSVFLAHVDSSGPEGNFGTHVLYERRALPTGAVIEQGVVVLDDYRPSAVVDAVDAQTLLVAANDSLGTFDNFDHLHRIDFGPNGPEVTTTPSSALSFVSHPKDIMFRGIMHLPTQDGRMIALIQANAVHTPQPEEVERSSIRMGVGRFAFDFARGEVVWPAVTAGQADLVERGYGFHSVSPDGRFMATFGGGVRRAPGNESAPARCAAHVRALPSFDVVGRLPCPPGEFPGIEYRTGVMTFSTEGGLLAAPRGDGGWLDIYALEPWRQVQRISARELGLRDVVVVAEHPVPRTFVVGSARRWLIIRID